MLKLILDIMPLVVIFACGYGVRDWMSRRRRKKARKRYYERRPTIPESDAHVPKIETVTGETGREPTIWELNERLSRLEDRIFGTRSETETFCDEPRSEFVATRTLAHQTTAQRARHSD
jgi:hypothetical protein